MSSPSLATVCPFLGPWLTVPDIVRLAGISRGMQLAARRACLVRLRAHLRSWFPAPDTFTTFMQGLLDTGSVISGDFVLRYLLDDEFAWQPLTLDIVCAGVPEVVGETMVRVLGEMGGIQFRRKTRRDFGEDTTGLVEERMFMMWQGNICLDFAVRLLYTSNDCALSCVQTAWATHLACAVSATSVVVAYPKTTFRRIGLLPPHRIYSPPAPRSLILNARRGFFVHNMPSNALDNSRKLPLAYWAIARRSLNDGATFRFQWCAGSVSTSARGLDGEKYCFRGEASVAWQYCESCDLFYTTGTDGDAAVTQMTQWADYHSVILYGV